MPVFAYTAIDSTGRTVRSTMEADSESLVLSKLRDQALHLIGERDLKAGFFELCDQRAHQAQCSLIGHERDPDRSLSVGRRKDLTAVTEVFPARERRCDAAVLSSWMRRFPFMLRFSLKCFHGLFFVFWKQGSDQWMKWQRLHRIRSLRWWLRHFTSI